MQLSSVFIVKAKLVTLGLVMIFALLSVLSLVPCYASAATCVPHPIVGISPRSQTVHTSVTTTASISYCDAHTTNITVKINEFLPTGKVIHLTGQPATGTYTFNVSVHGTYKVVFLWYNTQTGHQPLTKTAFVTSAT